MKISMKSDDFYYSLFSDECQGKNVQDHETLYSIIPWMLKGRAPLGISPITEKRARQAPDPLGFVGNKEPTTEVSLGSWLLLPFPRPNWRGAVCNCFFYLHHHIAPAFSSDLCVVSPPDDGFNGFYGFFVHLHGFMMLITSVEILENFRIALLSLKYSAPFNVI